MGDEIEVSHFTPADFAEFRSRLAAETLELRAWFEAGRFDLSEPIAGCEIEAWLVDDRCLPAPRNDEFLGRLGDPMVVPELARYNIELNTPPCPLSGHGISRMQADIARTWDKCRRAANGLGMDPVMIGILPTLTDAHLGVSCMSSMKRYQALNEQVLRQRSGMPLTLDILGRDHLSAVHYDVMLEAATTSFQIHLQVAQARAAACFNAAMQVSAPMVALAANSPFLFGCDLWAETRVPVFEQAVAVSTARQRLRERVTFGDGYVTDSLMECFDDNLHHYPPLLPELMDTPVSRLSHLRLHNGTVWRWNRPLVGFSAEGLPHLRIEHRVVPAGPSVIDTFANAALFYGLVEALSWQGHATSDRVPFRQARENFYLAARHGLDTRITWVDGRIVDVKDLVMRELLPLARRGLERLAIAPDDIALYLDVIAARVRTRQNGAVWQRRFAAGHGMDMEELTGAYLERQDSGEPVHEWTV